MILGINESVVLLVTLLGCCLYYFWKKRRYFKDRNILSVDGYPILGNTLRMYLQMEHLQDFLHNLYSKFPNERYVGTLSFTSPVVLIKDLDLIRQITIKDFDHFSDHIEFADADVDPLSGKMLLLLKGEQWREMRQTLSPAFTISKMRAMLPLMEDCGKEMIKYLDRMFANRKDKDNDVMDVEIKDTFDRCTTDILATCSFGIKTNSLDETDDTFYEKSKALTALGFWDSVKFGLIQFGSKDVKAFFKSLVELNVRERGEKRIVREDMIHLLMLAKQRKEELKKDTKLEWTNDDLAAQVICFMFAGLDTTATMLSFMSYELAKNEKIQRTLQQEIDDYLYKCDGKIEYDGIHHLKYLDMVCSETLRLWPTFPGTDRVCTKPYVLPPQNDRNGATLKLNEGDQIWIPTMSILRDPKYFPDPEVFDPERFSDERKDTIEPLSYHPFGVGPRQCIGTRFALMEVKILMINLLAKYDLVKVSKTPDPMKFKNSLFGMIPVAGFWVGLKPRRKSSVYV